MKKMLIAAAVSSIVLLSGCASEPSTSEKLDALSNQVSQISQDVTALKQSSATSQQVQEAKESADRANQRIDNIAKSYKK